MAKSSSKLYCVRCKAHRMCQRVRMERDVRGKPRMHGMCGSCGTHCFQYVSAKSAARRSGRRSQGRRMMF